MRRVVILSVLIACFSFGSASPGASAPAATSAKGPPRVPVAQYVSNRVTALLDGVEAGGSFADAHKQLLALQDLVIVRGNDNDLKTLRETAMAARLVGQLADVPSPLNVDLLKFLRKRPTLAATLAFQFRADRQSPAEVYGVLDRLRAKYADKLEKYANLATAICVVHAKPLTMHVNENAVNAPDPVELFDYYVTNESRMFFGVKNVPAELLIWVVDCTATIDELKWALNKYAGDREVGKRFFDIKYDTDAFRKGATKVVTQRGFSLRHVLEYGGVCADQAYFAMTVGKAIGVPTAYATGSSGVAGHAWVGFLQAEGSRGWWNFDTGRYQAYQGVRGNVRDPQTREPIPDCDVSLLAELIGTDAAARHNAIALTDAATRLLALAKSSSALQAEMPADVQLVATRLIPRKADAANIESLIDTALHQCAGYPPAWLTLRDLAQADKLTLAEKKRWASLLQRLGANKYPDFTLAIIAPMVRTVSDPKEQINLWDNLFEVFRTRFDLAASIRMEQAAVWETQQKPDNAGMCYMDVIGRFANAGPFVFEALRKAEKLLRDTHRGDKVVQLYEQTWASVPRPREMGAQFMEHTNWYRIGKLLAGKLQENGNAARAQTVNAELEQVVGKRQ